MDASPERKAAAELERANRALRLARDSSRILTFATDEIDWLNRVCQTAVDSGGYLLAWIGYAEHNERKTVRPVAQAGLNRSFLETADITWADDEHGRGPSGAAIRTGQVQVERDFDQNPRVAFLRRAAAAPGIRAAAAFPLRLDERVFGTFTICAGENEAFADGELAILRDLTDDLAHGIGVVWKARTERERVTAQLRESERKMVLAQALSHVGHWEYHARTGRLIWSHETYRIAGYEPGSIDVHLGMFDRLVHPDDQARRAKAIEEMKAGHPTYDTEYRIIRPDGQVRFVHSRGFTTYDEQGKPIMMFGTVQDITDLRTAEEALRQSEDRHRTLLECAPLAIYVHVNRVVTYANRAMCALLGATAPEQIVGRRIEQIVHPDFHAVVEQRLKEVAVGRPAPALEEKFVRLDGSAVDVEVNAAAVSVDSHWEIQVMARDITERKQAEAALRQQNALLEAQLNSTVGGILAVDSQGRKILQNRNMAELWKLPPELFESTDDRRTLEFVTRQVKDQTRFRDRVEYLYQHPDEIARDEIELADGRVLDRYTSPMMGPDGRHYGRIWIFRDITAQRRLEWQVRQAQKMHAIGQLAGGVAHDFNNILTVIEMQCSLLTIDPGLTPALKRNVEEVMAAAQRGGNLTRQLLSFARQDRKPDQDLDLAATVGTMLRLLRRVLGEDITLTSQLAPGLPVIRADPGRIEQIIMNLGVNSRDAMPQGGRLSIALDAAEVGAAEAALHPSAAPGRFVRITVSDTGVGIPRENLTRIFEPFFTTKEQGKGTGLGLATVFGIVADYKGWIEVESDLGHGSSFRVYLPAAERAAAAGPAVAAPPAASAAAKGETILLVEDEEAVRVSLRKILQRYGYQVSDAPTASAALELWRPQPRSFDLLITDLVIPGGVSGRELAEQLLAERPDLKVIFISGYSTDVAERRLPLGPGRIFLPKPFTALELATAIKSVLAGGG